MSLVGRHVLISGAARGLGAVLARHLAATGAQLTFADILETEGQAIATELGAKFLKVDLREPASIDALAEQISTPLHGLVNNGAIATGIGGIGFEDIAIDSCDKVI